MRMNLDPIGAKSKYKSPGYMFLKLPQHLPQGWAHRQDWLTNSKKAFQFKSNLRPSLDSHQNPGVINYPTL